MELAQHLLVLQFCYGHLEALQTSFGSQGNAGIFHFGLDFLEKETDQTGELIGMLVD